MSATRVFTVDYQFLSCGSVFTDGLSHAAAELGLTYDHALWQAPDLLGRIRAFRPHLLFITHGRKFCRQYGRQIADLSSAIWLLDEPYEVDDTADFARPCQTIFVCDPATLGRHQHAHYLPVCADPIVQFDDGRPRPAAVGFIGGANPVRNQYLAALAARQLLTYVIGGPFCPLVERLSQGHNIPAAATADRYRETQIIVNIFRSQHHFNRQHLVATSANPRIYEATACGALVVSEWRPELDTLCPEMPTFRSPDECVAIVAELVADPERCEMLRQACRSRLASHTYASRLQTVLEVTCGVPT